MTDITISDIRQGYEVADIFKRCGDEYRQNNGMTKRQHKVMNAIEQCRTDSYGYHLDRCSHCGHTEQDFNSCRDRHCPKCQSISRNKWVTARLNDILPVPYYHAVFTLPHQLNAFISHNKELIYDLLFSCAARTLLAFGRDPKWLGGEIGFYGILHTWGQTLWQHPHVHFIVPGGALSDDKQWLEPRYRRKFLFPVHALSKVFRGKFIERLKSAHAEEKLSFPPEEAQLADRGKFERWLDELVSRNWVVYCKRPFGDAEQVVRYIGRYTHRVAISNQRIIDVADGFVSFKYKDYKSEGDLWKTMQLNAHEFIRRFLWHVLPDGFHKIRHYGFLANGRRKTSIARIKQILHDFDIQQEANLANDGRPSCPKCPKGKMTPLIIVTRFGRMIIASANALLWGKQNILLDTS